MKEKVILLVIIAIAALTLQASASDRFQIVVHENNGNLAYNIFVEVWDGGNRVDSGYSDNMGAFYTWLERSIRYRITANGNGQTGEWQGFPENNIDIYMHN
ncbi:MAG: hypothetical protein NTX42_09390 [Methanothrix sp.]|nr:hypothetical protein [Methanothrix sp.]